MNVRIDSASSVGLSKDHRGRPSTPFLRERILRSAAVLFAQKEYDRVLIDEIAARAGVGKGSVYRQFSSKEELYAAVVIEGFAQLQREIRAALAGAGTVRDQVATIVQHSLAYFWSRRQFFALLHDPKALPRRQERLYHAQRQEFTELIGAVLRGGIERGSLRSDLDTRIAAEALLGMLRGINRYCREYTTPEAAVPLLVGIFIGGCTA
ncbi:MAG TPA: TetR/AcrR family transcriptional regulator [Candidatus Binataceae bacterium]|nr:TetR/AcrR family transcriptional regulator [Candidatus Binataceae bacterium]